MAVNRLTRDQIIGKALDLADSPTLDEKNRSDGSAIDTTAPAIEWLQQGVDLFYTLYPQAGTVTSTSIAIVAGTTSYAMPSDLILTYQNGIVLATDKKRLSKRSLSYVLNLDQTRTGTPKFYREEPPNWKIWPEPDKAYTGTAYYHKMPAALATGTVPTFPSDFLLVEYLHIKMKEWLNAVPKGSALQFALNIVSKFVKAGIINQLEEEQIPFDREAFPGGGSYPGSQYDWMGDVGTT